VPLLHVDDPVQKIRLSIGYRNPDPRTERPIQEIRVLAEADAVPRPQVALDEKRQPRALEEDVVQGSIGLGALLRHQLLHQVLQQGHAVSQGSVLLLHCR